MVGQHYQARTSNGERYFLTLYDDSSLSRTSRRRLHFTLPVTYQLQHSGLFPDLALPLPTLSEALHTEFMGWPLIVYPYIDGHLLDEEPYSAATQVELGGLLARLHAATASLELQDPVREEFTFQF